MTSTATQIKTSPTSPHIATETSDITLDDCFNGALSLEGEERQKAMLLLESIDRSTDTHSALIEKFSSVLMNPHDWPIIRSYACDALCTLGVFSDELISTADRMYHTLDRHLLHIGSSIKDRDDRACAQIALGLMTVYESVGRLLISAGRKLTRPQQFEALSYR